MTYFIIGLLIFLGTHSVRIYADGWRDGQISRLGLIPWKLIYGLVSAVGLGLIVWGYATVRQDSAVLWIPPASARYAAVLMTLLAFVLIVAAYMPRNRLKTVAGHPMVLGVALWALAHLTTNGRTIDLLLFGSFLVWAVLDYVSAVRRDKQTGTAYPVGTLLGTVLTVVIGLAGWGLFAGYLHLKLMGISPFG